MRLAVTMSTIRPGAMQRTSPNAPFPITLTVRKSSRPSFVLFNRMLHTLDNGALPLRADLLCALESDEGELEVMGSLLQGGLVLGLGGNRQQGLEMRVGRSCRHPRGQILTKVVCNAASFFKSSEPRFAIARVVSVRS